MRWVLFHVNDNVAVADVLTKDSIKLGVFTEMLRAALNISVGWKWST